jgi:hypothetical protein
VAFLSSLTFSCDPFWSSNSSTPSPPIIRRTPSPTSSRFSTSLFKLIRHSVKNKLPFIGLSLEAESALQLSENKIIKPLKRVASQPMTVTRTSNFLTPNDNLRHDYSPLLLGPLRSPNLNEDSVLVSSSPPPPTAIPMTAPIMTPNKASSPIKTNLLGVYGQRRLSEPDLTGSTPKGEPYI